jgi:non-heme chloroperoxidase
VVPIDVSGRRSVKLIPGAKLIVHPGAPHGITDTHKDRLNAICSPSWNPDLLAIPVDV